MDILSSTMNTVRGAGTGQVPDLGRPLTVRRDTFEDILADAEDEAPTTLQMQVQFANVATSTPIPDLQNTLRRGPNSQVHLRCSHSIQAYIDTTELLKDLFEEGFSHSLQVAAMSLESWPRWPSSKEAITLMPALYIKHG